MLTIIFTQKLLEQLNSVRPSILRSRPRKNRKIITSSSCVQLHLFVQLSHLTVTDTSAQSRLTGDGWSGAEIMSPTKGEGDILFLVRIPSVSTLGGLALRMTSHQPITRFPICHHTKCALKRPHLKRIHESCSGKFHLYLDSILMFVHLCYQFQNRIQMP